MLVLFNRCVQTSLHNGVTFSAFNNGHVSGDCMDGFVIADQVQLKTQKRKRHLEEDFTHAGD